MLFLTSNHRPVQFLCLAASCPYLFVSVVRLLLKVIAVVSYLVQGKRTEIDILLFVFYSVCFLCSFHPFDQASVMFCLLGMLQC